MRKIVLLLVTAISCLLPQVAFSQTKWRTTYWHPSDGNLPFANIPAGKYTHIIRVGVYPTFNGSTCGLDTTFSDNTGGSAAFISAVHAGGAKALVSIPNPSDSSFYPTCTSSSHLTQFASAIATYINSVGYDGVEVDWEGNTTEPNYANLYPALRAAFGTGKVIAGGCVSVNDRAALGNPTVYNAADQLNFCNYDNDSFGDSGPAMTYAWHQTNLHNNPSDSNAGSADNYYGFMTGAGIPLSKMGLGIPFYGRIKTGIVAGACTAHIDGPTQVYCSGSGTSNGRAGITYASLITGPYSTDGHGTHVLDSTVGAEYIKYDNGSSTAFITYAGAQYIQLCVNYINAKGLGGIMSYDLQQEYLSTQSGDARYPLSTALYSAMTGGSSSPNPPTGLTATVQ